MSTRQSPLLVSIAGLALSLGLVACGNSAEAMAKKSQEIHPHPAVTIDGSADYKKGYELGHRNGSLISKRLRDATLGTQGCSALRNYQDGLIEVARHVKAPRGNRMGKELSKGFFRGYLDSVRASIEDSRMGCAAARFEHGGFAGELYGALLCSAAEASLDSYLELESTPLYPNWAGGSVQVKDQCVNQALITLSACEADLHDVQSTTELLLNVSCSD